MELALRETAIPTEHEMMVYHTMAEQAVSSKMYRGIGEKAGVMMVMLSARELGIPPMQALNGGINLINGKAEISARMMGALIRKAGHKFVVKESTDLSCTLLGTRCDTKESQEASFNVEEAQRAGLVKQGGGWTKWPKDMCFARALSRLSRQLFSDVIGIGYVEGEIVATDAEIITPACEIHESPTTAIEDTYNLVKPEDLDLFKQFIEVIKGHFSWTDSQVASEFLKDVKKTQEKFKTWKDNQTKKVKEVKNA